MEEDVWWAKWRWLRHHTPRGTFEKRLEPNNINRGGGNETYRKEREEDVCNGGRKTDGGSTRSHWC